MGTAQSYRKNGHSDRTSWACTDANAEDIYLSYETADVAVQLCELVRANRLIDSLLLSQSGFNFDNAAQKLFMDALKG